MNRFYRNIDVMQGDDTYNQGRPEDFVPGRNEYSLNMPDGSQSHQFNQNSQNNQNNLNNQNNSISQNDSNVQNGNNGQNPPNNQISNSSESDIEPSPNTQNTPNSAINTPLYPTDEQNAEFNERLTMSVNPIENMGNLPYASPYTGMGSLRVQTFTADQALPLENVKITVTSNEEALSNIHETRYTDSSGRTEFIKLPAPAAELSQQSQLSLRPYAVYNVVSEIEGYSQNTPVINAVVFDNVQSLQNIPLIANRENE